MQSFGIMINKHQKKPNGQSRMDNTETQPTLGTRHRTKTKKQPKNMTQKEKNGLG